MKLTLSLVIFPFFDRSRPLVLSIDLPVLLFWKNSLRSEAQQPGGVLPIMDGRQASTNKRFPARTNASRSLGPTHTSRGGALPGEPHTMIGERLYEWESEFRSKAPSKSLTLFLEKRGHHKQGRSLMLPRFNQKIFIYENKSPIFFLRRPAAERRAQAPVV